MGAKNSKTKLPPEELSELEMSTHFDSKELKKWYQGFVRDCPDGALNKEQFINLYNTFYQCGNASKFASHVFRTFDCNNDGTIDFREFISSLSVTTRGTLDEKSDWAFHIYDIDGDGYITQNELLSIVRAVQKMVGAIDDGKETKVKMTKIFNKMDKNHDSRLSLEEFTTGAKEDESLVHMLQAYTPK